LTLFGQKAGSDLQQKPAFATFKPDDYNDFIK